MPIYHLRLRSLITIPRGKKEEINERKYVKIYVSTTTCMGIYMQAQATQQGVFESMHRTLMIGVGNWEFSPLMDLENPFPNNEGSVHLWQGDGDRIVPVKLQRYIANKLPWIKYHELPGSGHFFPCAVGMGEVVIRALLSGYKKPTFDCIG
jgi:pimeloyl-ACP methyl ester carboxylesterase